MPVLGNSCLVWGMRCLFACFIHWFVDDLMTLYVVLSLSNIEWAEVMNVGLHESVNRPGGEINGSGRFHSIIKGNGLGGGGGIDWGCWGQERGTIFILEEEEVTVICRKLRDLNFPVSEVRDIARVWEKRNAYKIFLGKTRRKETTWEPLLVGRY